MIRDATKLSIVFLGAAAACAADPALENSNAEVDEFVLVSEAALRSGTAASPVGSSDSDACDGAETYSCGVAMDGDGLEVSFADSSFHECAEILRGIEFAEGFFGSCASSCDAPDPSERFLVVHHPIISVDDIQGPALVRTKFYGEDVLMGRLVVTERDLASHAAFPVDGYDQPDEIFCSDLAPGTDLGARLEELIEMNSWDANASAQSASLEPGGSCTLRYLGRSGDGTHSLTAEPGSGTPEALLYVTDLPDDESDARVAAIQIDGEDAAPPTMVVDGYLRLPSGDGSAFYARVQITDEEFDLPESLWVAYDYRSMVFDGDCGGIAQAHPGRL